MVLESIAGRIEVQIATEIRKDKHCCAPFVLRIALDHLPYLCAKPVSSPNAIQIK
ncbi:hypothetical protein HDF14_004348 [Edaphobacter lichenicola]|uniref:Uncharacterized protein n=1 Tax=Tunturiibacter gelidiferens TaxID=3069689 RepID=A0A9X0U782_9BACT|nr:hypothetical protein [Edaphobacter lichenicola]